jgi:hypothetical protein
MANILGTCDSEDLMILAECASILSSHSINFTAHTKYPRSYPHQAEFMRAFILKVHTIFYVYVFLVLTHTKLKSYIERCLQGCLTMEEACKSIYCCYAIEPGVTEIGVLDWFCIYLLNS